MNGLVKGVMSCLSRLQANVLPSTVEQIDSEDSEGGAAEIFPLTDLPTEMLLHVISFLNQTDKLNVANACKSWRNLILQSPCLWRCKEITLKCSRQSSHSKKAYLFAKRLGRHLRRLSISCEHPSNHSCRYIAVSFRKLLTNLREPTLTSFKVTDLRLRSANPSVIRKLTTITTRLLERQPCLKIFQMTSAQWPPTQGHHVMRTLLSVANTSLHTLAIDGFFIPRYTPVHLEDFNSGLASLCHLTKLAIDYFYMTDETVMALATANRGRLRKLKLVVCDASPDSPRVSTRAWTTLTQACPSLRVESCFKGHTVSPSRSIPYILDPAMRLFKIRLSIGASFTLQNDPRLNMAAVLTYITTHFRKRLVRFEMDIDNHEDPIDGSLLRLVRKCKHLISLKVLAYFASEQTDQVIRDIVKERRSRQAVSKLIRSLEKTSPRPSTDIPSPGDLSDTGPGVGHPSTNSVLLGGACRSGPSLSGAGHNGSSLSGAGYSGSSLSGAGHSGSSLDGAGHGGSSLSGAGHNGSSLGGAGHSGLSLSGAGHSGSLLGGTGHSGSLLSAAGHSGLSLNGNAIIAVASSVLDGSPVGSSAASGVLLSTDAASDSVDSPGTSGSDGDDMVLAPMDTDYL